ncbi:MAG: hypothetical protein DDT38_01417 [Firmicutes bacterium]|nr:hypothetical protein [candidate division NPL-UPA2 bacterium]
MILQNGVGHRSLPRALARHFATRVPLQYLPCVLAVRDDYVPVQQVNACGR